jgi:uncharacterized SAM-binding protein YcdF (DUF218 family)
MEKSMDDAICTLAKILWEYLRIDMPLRKAEGILIFCSNDLRVAEYAAALYHRQFAPWICPSGGVGRLTYDLYHKPEAEAFADVLRREGVPDSVIFIEDKATNTAENVSFTKRILKENRLADQDLIVLQKPYMERRTLATLTYYWPELNPCISSPPISFEDYPFEGFSMEDLIHVLVGDFQRIILYAQLGWQSPQPVPEDVYQAFSQLIKAGYTRQLANPDSLPSRAIP